MAVVEVQDSHTYYGEAYVLQGLSLQLEQGQVLGLLGRNGVGKSTLVNSIVGFNPPGRGKVIFKGEDVTNDASFETVRKGMGLVQAQIAIGCLVAVLDHADSAFQRLLRRRNQLRGVSHIRCDRVLPQKK